MKTILLTDDSEIIREYWRSALQVDGYRVLLAADGLEALHVFCREAPDLVVLDICMPRMNGLGALRCFKTIAPEIPVILFTAHDDDCLRDHAAELATACVEKSADRKELSRTIKRAFRSPSPTPGRPENRFTSRIAAGRPPLAGGYIGGQ
jgi:CheY-like chemotaxis protein